jgi:hypothetical protein
LRLGGTARVGELRAVHGFAEAGQNPLDGRRIVVEGVLELGRVEGQHAGLLVRRDAEFGKRAALTTRQPLDPSRHETLEALLHLTGRRVAVEGWRAIALGVVRGVVAELCVEVADHPVVGADETHQLRLDISGLPGHADGDGLRRVGVLQVQRDAIVDVRNRVARLRDVDAVDPQHGVLRRLDFGRRDVDAETVPRRQVAAAGERRRDAVGHRKRDPGRNAVPRPAVVVPGHAAVGRVADERSGRARNRRIAGLHDLDDVRGAAFAGEGAAGRDGSEVRRVVVLVGGGRLDGRRVEVERGIVVRDRDRALRTFLLRREHEPVRVRRRTVVDDLRADIGVQVVDGVGELTQRRRIVDVDGPLGPAADLELEGPGCRGDARRTRVGEALSRHLMLRRDLQHLNAVGPDRRVFRRRDRDQALVARTRAGRLEEGLVVETADRAAQAVQSTVEVVVGLLLLRGKRNLLLNLENLALFEREELIDEGIGVQAAGQTAD